MSTIISPVQPLSTILKPLVSSSRYMVRARQQEMLPLQQTSFTPTTNTVIEFQIASADSFIDWASSYIRLQLSNFTLLNNGALDVNATMSEAGVHSLFRRVSLRSATGAMICEQLNYNILAPMLSSALQSREQVRSVGMIYGDSPSPWYEFDDKASKSGWHPIGVAQTTVGISSSTVTMAAATALEPGDWILLTNSGANYLSALVQVDTVTSSTVFVAVVAPPSYIGTSNVQWDGNIIKAPQAYHSSRLITAQDYGGTAGTTRVATASADFDAKPYHAYQGIGAVSIMNPAASSSQGITLCFSPWLEYFRRGEWDPVFLVQGGFILSLELETQPARCIQTCSQVVSTGFSGATFTISNPRFIAKMIQPTEKLRDQYINLFKGPGLFYSFRNYAHYATNDSLATNVTQQISVGKRGVNHVLCAIQSTPEMTVSSGTVTDAQGSTYTVDSLATRLSAGLQRYYFTALSLNYPLDNFIRMEYDYYNSEPLLQLDYALSQYGSVLANHRFLPYEWMSVNNVSGITQESKRLILAANFAKDDSPFTGVDLSQSPLQINLQFSIGPYLINSASALRYILLFINHDNLAYYSSAHGIQIQN